MVNIELAFAKQEINSLKSALHLSSSQTSQILEMIRVELEENDDPEAALEIIQEWENQE